jgi:hypothetical protein
MKIGSRNIVDLAWGSVNPCWPPVCRHEVGGGKFFAYVMIRRPVVPGRRATGPAPPVRAARRGPEPRSEQGEQPAGFGGHGARRGDAVAQAGVRGDDQPASGGARG